MKRPLSSSPKYLRIVRQTFGMSLALGVATAYAGPMSPSGDHSEARLETVFVPSVSSPAVVSGPPQAAQVVVPLAPSALKPEVVKAPAQSALSSKSAESPTLQPVSPVAPVVAAKPIAKPTTKPALAQKPIQKQVQTWVQNKWTALTAMIGIVAPKPSVAPAAGANAKTGSPRGNPSRAVASTEAPLPQDAPSNAEPPKVRLPDPVGMKKNNLGVPVYDLSAAPVVPLLDLEREQRIGMDRYALDQKMQKIVREKMIRQLHTPDVYEGKKLMTMLKPIHGKASDLSALRDPLFLPKGPVSREGVDRIVLNNKPEISVQLKPTKPLTPEEMQFLSALLLFNQGGKCSAALGLFHRLSKLPSWAAEANYYVAMCSRELGLESDFIDRTLRIFESQDVYYTPKIAKELKPDIPYELTERLGAVLARVIGGDSVAAKALEKLEPTVKGNVGYLLTEFGISTGRYKEVLSWAKMVPEKHAKYLEARFLMALAEYEVGDKERALKIQHDLINHAKTEKTQTEFQALVALNLGRMHFQKSDFKKARESFLGVYKDHPMWLQSLTEMGWAQLQSGDFEGAIGNMYSIQSPFFNMVYKPESYVIRTIGYLNLCQYGDAYRTLSILEHEYRPALQRMSQYISNEKNRGVYYQTVRNYLSTRDAKEVDGLPGFIIREMARHRDFTNLQKALNRQIDEREIYRKIEGAADGELRQIKAVIMSSRKKIEVLRKNLGLITVNPQLAKNQKAWTESLEQEMEKLNLNFFLVDLYKDAQETLPVYQKDALTNAEKRLASTRSNIESTLEKRLSRMKSELELVLENNELLRYEVFAGSGENIRYQVAGGEQSNRIPANVAPKSKALQWAFDGEYWEDEIGHYRSSLKNNCPDAPNRDQANLSGGVE